MWLLHIRPNYVGRGVIKGTMRSGGRRSERVHERQYLSLWRLSKHCECDSERAAKRQSAETGMKTFELTRATDNSQAVSAAAKTTTAQQGAEIRFIAGGTTLIDLMKLNVETPQKLIDVNHLPLTEIDNLPDGGLTIGAMVRNSDLAYHPIVRKNYAVLSEAILSGASAQLRNMATTAGNLLQRTRCVYFRDIAMPCNKREPGSGCAAITGVNRSLAILGTSEHCIATNPSDMNVALAALEATIHIRGTKGERSVPIGDFHLVPGDTPHRETILEPGDLITHVTLPPAAPGSRSVYLKLRDRASYEFALASAAVVATVANGKLTRARIALGGVGTKPWRSTEAERELTDQPPTPAVFQKAADAALRDAKPQSQNGFKVELAKRCLVHALKLATQNA
jgi:xanthine dehydrogenase YagS FAD-binding subunit